MAKPGPTTSEIRPLDAPAIRALRLENPKARARDFAAMHGITKAELVAAHLGQGVIAIDPHPDRQIPLVGTLGDVMAPDRRGLARRDAVKDRPDHQHRGL